LKALSGGERNRLLLARLFARPANVLVMDEPTNDLDIESLELLEETLQTYPGTLLLVSHDRAFLDNVVTQTLVAEGNGHWQDYVGGYSDWLAQRPQPETSAPKLTATKAAPEPRAAAAAPAKLSFKENRELTQLPAEIEALEIEQTELTNAMMSADYHRRTPEQLRADRERLSAIELELAQKFERWSALEEKSAAIQNRDRAS
jgi:ATP-binding cassette subfamily F protein uup